MKTIKKGILLQQIGMRLKKLKIDSNKSSKEVASLLNITPQAYGNMERGESDICITRLVLLAEYYNKSLQELIPDEYQNCDNNPKEDDSTLNGKTFFLGNNY
jgi:transcriptional regulator with XRE-family HTH domain